MNATQKRTRERHVNLWNTYFHNIPKFCSEHLVFVDESGCDRRIGFRRTGRSCLGVAPVQVSQFHRRQQFIWLPFAHWLLTLDLDKACFECACSIRALN